MAVRAILVSSAAVVVVGKTMRAKLEPYPGYTGDLQAKGSVRLRRHRGISFQYDLAGLEPSVSGGVHIHEGTTCASADGPGGHYWKSGDDPWSNVYTSDADGESADSSFIDSRIDAWGNYGHAAVVHAESGERVGCGVIEAMAKMENYPDHVCDGDCVDGAVKVDEVTGLEVAYKLKGLDADSSGGLHIHTGVSCDTHAEVGGHYWAEESVVEDPWNDGYESDDRGRSKGDFKVYSGVDKTDNLDHAVVVHANDGTRIACGILKKRGSKLRAKLTTYPGYEGALEVSGSVYVRERPMLALTYSLEHLEGAVTGGLHIHTGTTCDAAADVGGHYWDERKEEVDPWNSATTYTSNADGAGAGTFAVYSGLELEDVVGHAVVAHAADGSRVSCGVISLGAIIGKYPGYEGALTVTGATHVADAHQLKLYHRLYSMEESSTGSLHIHTGTTCDAAADVGGHYWNTDMVKADPWVGTFDTSSSGKARGTVHYWTGFTQAENEGHAVVVHAADGTRIACGVL